MTHVKKNLTPEERNAIYFVNGKYSVEKSENRRAFLKRQRERSFQQNFFSAIRETMKNSFLS